MNKPIESDDATGIEQVWRTLPAQRPSSFQSARMERSLDVALSSDRRSRMGDRPTWVLVAATGFCGMAFGAWAMQSEWSPWAATPAVTIAIPVATAQPSPPTTAPAALVSDPPTIVPAAKTPRPTPAVKAMLEPVNRAVDSIALALPLVSGDDAASAAIAATQLVAAARRDDGDASRILAALGTGPSGMEASRVLCQVHLLSRRNEESIQVCRGFVDDHPSEQHVFGILLAVAALGEELNRWHAVDAALSDAWSWSLQHGLPTAELAFRRAHARMQLDRLDEARADLRAGLVDQGSRPLPMSAKTLAKRLGVQLTTD